MEALGRLRQEDYQEFKACLGSRVQGQTVALFFTPVHADVLSHVDLHSCLMLASANWLVGTF